MIDEKTLELVTLELATETISQEVYQYHTEWGIPVVYYVFDMQKLDEGIYAPIYFTTEDISRFKQSEDELFQKALENTVFFMQSQIIPFSQYMKEFVPDGADSVRLILVDRLVKLIEGLEDRRKLWCVTNSIRQRGACGCFCKPLLRLFCDTFRCPRVLIGINNNDYAFLVAEEPRKAEAMKILAYQVGHMMKGKENILQRGVLVYDYESDTLKNYEGNEK